MLWIFPKEDLETGDHRCPKYFYTKKLKQGNTTETWLIADTILLQINRDCFRIYLNGCCYCNVPGIKWWTQRKNFNCNQLICLFPQQYLDAAEIQIQGSTDWFELHLSYLFSHMVQSYSQTDASWSIFIRWKVVLKCHRSNNFHLCIDEFVSYLWFQNSDFDSVSNLHYWCLLWITGDRYNWGNDLRRGI